MFCGKQTWPAFGLVLSVSRTSEEYISGLSELDEDSYVWYDWDELAHEPRDRKDTRRENVIVNLGGIRARTPREEGLSRILSRSMRKRNTREKTIPKAVMRPGSNQEECL